jgi:DEAD/DEAH box helicase domain-containing protein
VGLQTLAFTRSRQGVERMYKNCREFLKDRNLSQAIRPYRSGYFDREREELEKK